MMRAAFLTALLATSAPIAAFAGGWALGGMDAVAYLTEGRAVPGDGAISTRWAGQEWHFGTEANRAAFEANPRAYAPGLRGHCPVALAQGRVVPGNPRYFTVAGNRLYLMATEEAWTLFRANPQDWLGKAKANADALGQ